VIKIKRKKERYDKQTIILETKEGLARTKKNLVEVWKLRIKEHFPHYKLINAKLEKGKGKKR